MQQSKEIDAIFTPKQGGTPKRNEIAFISPTGEEIKNRRQLDQYLRSHPGGPPSSEFDWGTGDTPRRSARISEKVKTPEAEKLKRASSSGSQKGTKRKKNTEDDGHKLEEEGSGSQKGTKRKKNSEDDGLKTEGKTFNAGGEDPKDVDMEDTKGVKHNKSKEEASSEGIHSLVEEESADKTKENVEDKVEQDVEQSGGKGTELESTNEAKKNENGTEIFPPASDSEKVVLNEKKDEDSVSKKDDEASLSKKVAEILSENGAKDEQVDNFEPGKEIPESPNDTEVSQAGSDSKKNPFVEKDDDVSATEKDEAPIHLIDEEILPDNDGKDEEVNTTTIPKEVKENLNDTEISPPVPGSEKVSLTGKDDEASAAEKGEASVSMNGAETSLSENGGKKLDDGKSQFESFSANR